MLGRVAGDEIRKLVHSTGADDEIHYIRNMKWEPSKDSGMNVP